MLQGLIDSKKEYVEHLCDLFAEPMVACFQKVYNECLNKPQTRNKGVLQVFQDELSALPAWNVNLIKEEYLLAKNASTCNYLGDLVKAILVTYVKISILSNGATIDSSSVKLRVPSAENFYHRCLILCARELWKQPYLIYHKVRSIEAQQNLNEAEVLARKAIKSALRLYIPMDQLVNSIRLEDTPIQTNTSSQSESESESSDDESEEDEEDVIEADEESSSEEEEEVCEIKPNSDHDISDDSTESCEEIDESNDYETESSDDGDDVYCESIDQQEPPQEADEPHDDEPTPHVIEQESTTLDDMRKSIEVDTNHKVEHVPNSPVVLNKIEDDDTEPPSPVEGDAEVPVKKVLYGSMLFGNHIPIKKHKPMKHMKRDAFF